MKPKTPAWDGKGVTHPMRRVTKALAEEVRGTSDETRIHDAAVEVFAGAMGGRQALASLLAWSDDPRIHDALSYLTEHDGQKHSAAGYLSLKEICRRADVTVADFYKVFLDATWMRAQVRIAPMVAEKLVDTTRDLMEKTVDRELECRVCKGTGVRKDGKDCKPCDGVGRVFKESDFKRQEAALEMGGLLKRDGGVHQSVHVMQSGSVASGIRSYEDEQAEMDGWLKRTPKAIEGTVVVTKQETP